MKDSHILALKTPMISNYTILGAVASICEEHNEDYLLNAFTQVVYHADWRMMIFEEQNNLPLSCPFFRTETLTVANDISDNDIINTLISLINTESYVYMFLDRKLLVPEIDKENFAHTTLVYGYDLNDHVFYLADNYKDGKFVSITRNMNVVAQAFISSWNSSVGNTNDNDGSNRFEYLKQVLIINYRPEISVAFNVKSVIRGIESYIKCTPTDIVSNNNIMYYGKDCYKLFHRYLAGDENLSINKRDFNLLYEHKMVLEKAVQKLLVTRNISDENLLLQIGDIRQQALIIRNMFVKSTLVDENRRKTLFVNMMNKMHEMELKEEKVLSRVLKKFR